MWVGDIEQVISLKKGLKDAKITLQVLYCYLQFCDESKEYEEKNPSKYLRSRNQIPKPCLAITFEHHI